MKAIRFTLIVALAAALLAPAVGAQDDAGSEGVVIELESHTSENGENYFTLVGDAEKNPTLTVPAGEQVTLRLTNVNGYHNVATDAAGGHESEYVAEEGATTEITFTAEAGEYSYFCVPHKSMGMAGTLVVEGEAGTTDDAGDNTGSTDDTASEAGNNNAPGAGAVVAVLALAGLAALVGRRQ